jgi:ATP-dependent helicase/nuclease subunit A
MTSHMSGAAYALDGKPCTAQAFYAVACDPQRHVVVQACAGAGKTWMLVSRIVRALLAGAQPHEILAITFTKKAAGEMRTRLQEWLLEFSLADEDKLLQELESRGITRENALSPKQDLRKLLSNLYQQSLLWPRTVQILTFHSWFASLLRSAPLSVLEALELPSTYDLLEGDDEAIELVWPRFYALLLRDEGLHAVYRAAVAQVGRSSMDKALTQGLKKRVEFAMADAAGVVARCVEPLATAMPAFAGMDDPTERMAAQLELMQKAARHLAQTHQASFSALGTELEQALTVGNWQAALDALLTQKGEPRKLSEKIVGIEHIRLAQQLCVEVLAALDHQDAWQHHHNMAQLMRALSACFAELKRSRNWVDMGDLERAAMRLLQDEQVAGWVQQRLDAQVKHLLLDEFQDTNPLQWQALESWLSGYAGAGGGSRGGQGGNMPSVFIVGDAKQSIYRFRRAEPQVFEAATAFVCQGLQGHLLTCDHTRRNAPQVIGVVNAVMAQVASESDYPFRPHTTGSDKQGSVLRLPLAPRPVKASAQDHSQQGLTWRDTLTEARDEPDEKAVDAECALAARWVATQISRGKEPQSFMILARKRDRLSRMRDALRALGVPSQITEKTALIELPEVRDIVALLDALVSPGNDLALAQALKSPLLGWRDEDLVALARAKQAAPHLTWLELLLNQEHSAQEIKGLEANFAQKTASDLCQCQIWLAQLPPHDALSAVYGRLNVLARFAAAAPAPLRQRVQGSLRALLSEALQASGGRFLTPHAWIRQLKSLHLQAPQVAQSAAVQLMTVHGAKGLEADTVILLDSNNAPPQANSLDVLVDWPGQSKAPTIFAFLRSEKRVPRGLLPALTREQAQREREDLNTLYVAMTRAKMQLVISGHEVLKAVDSNAWKRFEALGDQVEEAWHGDFALLAGISGQQEHSGSPASGGSFLMPFVPLSHMEYAQSAIESVVNKTPDDAARIGSCMHRLLELYRPGQDLSSLAGSVAGRFDLTESQAAQALQSAQSILQGEAAWVWDPSVIDWQADEVELLHQGQILRIDRLVKRVDSQTWWVLDYKSSPAPQRIPEFKEQLGQYREAVQQAYPDQAVKAAFITAQGALIQI